MRNRMNLLVTVLLLAGPPAARGGIVTFTDSASFFAAANGVTTETYESLASGFVINSVDTVNTITYTSFPSSTCGVVGSNFNTIDTNALELGCGQDFFFPGDQLSVAFAWPVYSLGVFFNAGDHPFGPLFAQAGPSAAFDNNVPEFSSFYFVGLVSDTPFQTAIFGSDPNGSAFTLDNLSYSSSAPAQSAPEPGSLTLLIGGLLLLIWRRRVKKLAISIAILAATQLHAQNTTAVTILKPLNATAINAASLDVQALVSDFVPAPPGANPLAYWTQVNAAPGRLTRAELRLDGVLIQTRTLQTCLRQALVTFPVSLANVAQGTHQAQVTTFQRQGAGEVSKAVSVSFTLDTSLNPPQDNPVERAATPQTVGCLLLAGFDADAGPSVLPGIQGRFRLGDGSNGIDLSHDRVVIDVGNSKTVLEPGAFVCNAGTCSFADNAQPVVQNMQLAQLPDGSWGFLIQGNLPANPASLYLRIGNDWGGRLLTTGEFLVRLKTALDASHRSQATIGQAGGSIQTVNAAGVKIRLDVPAGALSRNTAITLSPLAATPLANAPAPTDVGVQFDPEGLQFADAATLTFDFSATAATLSGAERIYLMTEPGTKAPLYGGVDLVNRTITAHIWHFSAMEPSAATAAFEDLKAWADAFLASVNGNVTFQSLETTAALAADQMRLGCTHNCVDLAVLSNGVQTAITNLVAAACPSDISSPTDQALNRYLQLESLAQGMGAGTVSDLSVCYTQILSRLIDQAGIDALASATQAPDDPKLERLRGYATKASLLGLNNLENMAWTRMAQALRSLASSLLANGHSADGTPNEAVKRQQGIDGLTQELQWVTTIAPGVSTVDPALAGFIQAAIDELKSSIAVLAVGRDSIGTSGEWLTDTNCVASFNRDRDPESVALNASIGLPLSQQIGCNVADVIVSRLKWTLSNSAVNTVALDLDGNGTPFIVAPGDPTCKFGPCSVAYYGANIGVQFTVTRPGTLAASLGAFALGSNDMFGARVTNPVALGGAYPGTYLACTGRTLAADPNTGNVIEVPFCTTGAGAGSISVPGAGTYRVQISVFRGTIAFKGRAVTLIFTPVP